MYHVNIYFCLLGYNFYENVTFCFLRITITKHKY